MPWLHIALVISIIVRHICTYGDDENIVFPAGVTVSQFEHTL